MAMGDAGVTLQDARASALASSLARLLQRSPELRAPITFMRSLLEGGGEVFARHWMTPGHFTASGMVVNPDGTAVLLIFHPVLKLWLQPGGHVEPHDETLQQAALREVIEETGLDVEPLGVLPLDVDVHEIPENARRGESAHLHLDVRWAFRARHEEASAGGGVEAVRWVPFEALDALHTDASVRRGAAALRAWLLAS